MKQSSLFTKTQKLAPKDEVSKNAILLIRAGFVHKEMAGVYSYLPLGLRTLEKIKGVIREEMNKAGGQEIVMTALQEKQLWQKTDRWDDDKVDNWFKSELKNGTEVGFGITHEEPLTNIMKAHISSYRDLPIYAYQFQNKFRNEVRAKSGIMRGREFMMKDMYDFSKNEEEHNVFYNSMRDAYINICERVGIGHLTYPTFATGGIFSQFSEEFQTISEAGEDIIYVDEDKKIAVNKEVYNDEVLSQLGLDKDKLVEMKSIETGNLFHLGTKFSEPLELLYTSEDGKKSPVYMGSYGLGPTRLMGTLVEVLSDEHGMIWPESVAPFKVHILSFNSDEKALELYEHLTSKGIEVLLDDREERPGSKLADADLIGIPYRVVVSDKSFAAGGYEVKKRKDAQGHILALEALTSILLTKKHD